MTWLDALLRWLLGLPPGQRPPRAVLWVELSVLIACLIDVATGRAHLLPQAMRRSIHARLNDWALLFSLALNDRAREIAGLPRLSFRSAQEALVATRLAETPAYDVDPQRLIRRALGLFDQLQRFEALAQRLAVRLKRDIDHAQATRHATALPALVLTLLAQTPRIADMSMRATACDHAACDCVTSAARVLVPP